MFKVKSPVLSNGKIENEVYLLKIHSPQISKICKPGQFCNIKVSDSDFPLLRRPFSICDVEGENLYFMFDIQGEGTKLLSERKSGTHLDILGPLGNGFEDCFEWSKDAPSSGESDRRRLSLRKAYFTATGVY